MTSDGAIEESRCLCESMCEFTLSVRRGLISVNCTSCSSSILRSDSCPSLRKRERKNRNRLVHHYGQHRLTNQQGTQRPSLPFLMNIAVQQIGHTQREKETWCLTSCLIIATKFSVVLVNRIQMSSCLIQCLTLSGCFEGQRIRLYQIEHYANLC